MKNLNRTPLFSQAVYSINCENHFDYLLKEAYNIKEKYGNIHPIPELMYESANQNIFFTEPSFFPLKDFIKEKVNSIYPERRIEFKQSWINFSYKYNFQPIHDHPGNDIVGVYYISYPTNSGEISIHNKNLTTEVYNIIPYNGLMLLFDSDQPHSVNQNLSDYPRIALPFNIKFY